MNPENEYIIEGNLSPEEFLEEKRKSIRSSSYWSIGIGVVIILLHLVILFWAGKNDSNQIDYTIIFRSILFIFAVIMIIGGIWEIYGTYKLKIEDFVVTPEIAQMLAEIEDSKPFFSIALIVLIVVAFIISLGSNNFVEIGGLVKPNVWEGEVWRLLTCGALHGSFIHIYFNAQALYGLGKEIEFLIHRSHLPIVFLLSVLSGSLFSLILMPEISSVGASGGLLGLVGYLAIYGSRNKQNLPPKFFRSVLVNIGFIALFGIIGFSFIDNAAHFGGLVSGLIYGYFQIPKDSLINLKKASPAIKVLGFASFLIFASATFFLIFKLLQN